MQTIRRICNRVIYLQNGQVIADGPADEITKNYLYSVGAEMGSNEENSCNVALSWIEITPAE
jgi:ABC-type polysaccharide/polyol phosphate transport system ATPase subunit